MDSTTAPKTLAHLTECDFCHCEGYRCDTPDGEIVSHGKVISHAPAGETVLCNSPEDAGALLCEDCYEAAKARRAAAAVLGSSRSPRKRATSAANGTRGGRPTTLALVDDLGRVVGITSAAPGRIGELVEYGSRIEARPRPDGVVEAPTFVVEGQARLRRQSKSDPDELRRWDIQ